MFYRKGEIWSCASEAARVSFSGCDNAVVVAPAGQMRAHTCAFLRWEYNPFLLSV